MERLTILLSSVFIESLFCSRAKLASTSFVPTPSFKRFFRKLQVDTFFIRVMLLSNILCIAIADLGGSLVSRHSDSIWLKVFDDIFMMLFFILYLLIALFNLDKTRF